MWIIRMGIYLSKIRAVRLLNGPKMKSEGIFWDKLMFIR